MLTKMKSSNRKILKYFVAIPVFCTSITYVACKNNSEPMALLKNTNKWESKLYKTGDNILCLNYVPQFQKANNYFEIKNEDTVKDAVLKLIYAKKEAIYRDVYIRSGENVKLKDIPLGDYYIKITFGNDWKETTINNKCFGKFTKDAEYQIRQNLFEFKIIESPWGKSASSITIPIKSRNDN